MRSKSLGRNGVGSAFVLLELRVNPASLLPDLQPLASYLNGWTVNTTASGQEVRYATAVANGGLGAFEIRGTDTTVVNPDGSQSQIVNQRVYQDDGGFADRPAGTFKYHSPHGHIHYEDFAWGQLRLRPADQSVGAVVATAPKASFALLDISRYNSSLPGSPNSPFYTTATAKVQGISVGWNDVYGSALEGQSVDASGLPNGDYWLELSIDPLNRVQESDETNNVIRVPVALNGQPPTGFRVLSASPSAALHSDLSGVTVNFNGAVDASTFGPADVSLMGPNGAITANSIDALSAVQYRINFPTQTTMGTYRLIVGPDIASAGGELMDQNNNGIGGEPGDQFFNNIIITSPHLDSGTPSGAVYTPVSAVRLTYNKPMAVSSFATGDVLSFTGPGGTDLRPQITGISAVASGVTSALFDVTFKNQTAFGTYTLVIEPSVLDPLENGVDQNLDGVVDAADRFTISFTISPVPPVGPDLFGYTAAPAAAESLGLAGRPGAFTVINAGDDVAAAVDLGLNSFTFYGQSYSGAGRLFVSSNGLITFGSPNTSQNNDDFSASQLASIAPFWDDLRSSGAAPAVLGLFEDADADGKPERLVIEWNRLWHHPSTPSTLTFQVALQLNTGSTPGSLLFNYPDIVADNTAYDYGASATIGIRDAGAGAGLLVSRDTGATPLIRYSPAVLLSVPSVRSIARFGPPIVSPGTAQFTVSFARPVGGVDVSDFVVNSTGSIAGAAVSQVQPTADPAAFLVTVLTGTGIGTLRLYLSDNDSIADALGAKLGGIGVGNGSFTNGETYTVQAPRTPVLVTAADAGASPHVIVRTDPDGDGTADTVSGSFFAFAESFRGGVRVATGDFDGDGLDELVTAAGPSGGPHVRVWKLSPTGSVTGMSEEFFAFGAGFLGGLWVATGDFDNDGRDELVVSADAGGGPHVRIYSDTDSDGKLGDGLVDELFAFSPGFTGGVRLAVGDFGGGRDRLVAAAGPFGGPHVKVFDNRDGDRRVSNDPLIDEFFAFDPSFRGGVFVGTGDLAGGAEDELIVGAGAGGGPHVQVFSKKAVGVGASTRLEHTRLDSFFAYGSAFTGGVRVGVSNLRPGSRADLITATGAGGQTLVIVWSGDAGTGQVSNRPKDHEFFGFVGPGGSPMSIGVFVVGGSV